MVAEPMAGERVIAVDAPQRVVIVASELHASLGNDDANAAVKPFVIFPRPQRFLGARHLAFERALRLGADIAGGFRIFGRPKAVIALRRSVAAVVAFQEGSSREAAG